MKADVLKFFSLQRQIFGICPHSGDFFRLSDCKIYKRSRPSPDWLGILESKTEKLDEAEERLAEKEEALREKARAKGRQLARHALRKIDTVFLPRKLNADDAKVIFHPVDYLVFNGMKTKEVIHDLLFIDRKAVTAEERKIQRSIEKVIEKGRYEWQTLRIDEAGGIKAE